MRNLLAHIPQGDKEMVTALVRTIFYQPDRAAARLQVAEVAARLEKPFPKAAALLRQAEDDVLAHVSFPREHRTRIYSTNPLEQLNREITRRAEVVQVFPNDDAALRLAGAILLEIVMSGRPMSAAISAGPRCRNCSPRPRRRQRALVFNRPSEST